LVIVGPCSIHDSAAALEYALRLKELAGEVSETLFLAMRVYVEKPRTATGWKGLVNDPALDGTCRIATGLTVSRQLLTAIAELGLPTATEAVDPVAQIYLHDLISWTAIGARTVESQTHREMASGLPSPVGFKNGTSGDLKVAMHAMRACGRPHQFLGIDSTGRASIISSAGNRDTHIVLRGGARPNYDSASVAACERSLAEHGLRQRIMIDCSHANAQKRWQQEPLVMNDAVNQIVKGNRSIRALLIESHLHAGSQVLAGSGSDLRYGVSITDECMDWATTEQSLLNIRHQLRQILPERLHVPRSPGRARRATVGSVVLHEGSAGNESWS